MKNRSVTSAFLFALIFFISCSKEPLDTSSFSSSTALVISAQKEFASVLSSALSNEPDLRMFLKMKSFEGI